VLRILGNSLFPPAGQPWESGAPALVCLGNLDLEVEPEGWPVPLFCQCHWLLLFSRQCSRHNPYPSGAHLITVREKDIIENGSIKATVSTQKDEVAILVWVTSLDR
jgi:hypothetical protein